MFSDVQSNICPTEVEIESTNISARVSTYLDLYISVHNGKYNLKLLAKREPFNLHIINYPFLLSNIPRNATYSVLISHLIKLCRFNYDIRSLW